MSQRAEVSSFQRVSSAAISATDGIVFRLHLPTGHDFRYVGFREDMGIRLRQHNAGQTRSTAPFRPLRAIVLREGPTREAARRSEKYFKSGHGRAQIARQLAAEKEGGRAVLNAQTEGLIGNPFAIAKGLRQG